MAHSIQRLTIFALISALELDLREFIQLYLVPVVGQTSLIGSELTKKCTERFQRDNQNDTPDLNDLIDYLDFGDELQIIRAHEVKLDDSTRSYLKRHFFGLESIIPIRNRVMHSRPLEFDDLMRVSDLSRTLIHSHRALWANLRTNMRALDRDPEFAATLTIPESPDDTTRILHNLPQPEFDDTGFMGREKELAALKKALTGSYPVVTVVGEGGVGKTALALKACYDLLDDNTSPLDAIIWTSAKTTKLTVNEIQLIEGAISSSLGVIESATSSLGRQTGTEAIDDLIEHMTNNKILLVIDNLETIVDENIRYLVTKLPTNSRILFTTRLPLGAYDFPISLPPLSKKEAASYFRTVALVLGVNDLATQPSSVLEEYCMKLHYNSLFIKWFVHSVQVGKRPTILISDPKIFLQFCLQNVFSSFSPETRTVAKILAALGGQQTVASLTFYADKDSLAIQSALSLLITANLVTATRGRTSEDEDRYALSSLALAYITKFVRMDNDEQRQLIRKQNELRSAQEQMSAMAGMDIFDINYVYIRTREDYIVAKILTRAIDRIFRGDLSVANSELEKAEDLNPNYFEVHRVRAFYNVKSGDYLAADASYSAAVSLAPDRAPLRVWYGGFISRCLGDQERALTELQQAETLAPDAPAAKLECARVMQYLRHFDDAEQRLNAIPNLENQPLRTRRMHLDLLLQNNVRKAEYDIDLGQPEDALTCLERAKEVFTNATPDLIDYKILKNLNHARRSFPALSRAFKGSKLSDRLSAVAAWLPFPNEQFVRPRRSDSNVHSDTLDKTGVHAAVPSDEATDIKKDEVPPNRGRLIQIHKNYAFIDTSGVRYFFHRGSWIGLSDFAAMPEGSIVEFDISTADGKPEAISVRPIDGVTTKSLIGREVSGELTRKEHIHGFITMDVGGEIYFHMHDCGQGTMFKKMKVGDRVKFKVSMAENGKRFAEKVELYSGQPIL